MFTIECGVNKIEKHKPISLKHVHVGCLIFDPHLTKHQSNIECLIKKSDQMIKFHTSNSRKKSDNQFMSMLRVGHCKLHMM